MKVGTLVRLRDVFGRNEGLQNRIVAGHGIGLVIACGVQVTNIRLVFFPKLGVKEWRAAHLLERVA